MIFLVKVFTFNFMSQKELIMLLSFYMISQKQFFCEFVIVLWMDKRANLVSMYVYISVADPVDFAPDLGSEILDLVSGYCLNLTSYRKFQKFDFDFYPLQKYNISTELNVAIITLI